MAAAPTISRRNLFRYGAATGAATGAAMAMPAAHAHGHGLPRVSPAPKPIPGGIPISDELLIHTFLPGPEDVTLPFTGLTLQGLEVEPSVITDYRGVTALAYHVGTATGSDGRRYDLETDIRAMEGTYIAEDGSRKRALFAGLWIDLFEPGTGSPATQLHDYNGGIQPSGLFWVVELPRDAFRVSHDGRRATLEAKDVCLVNSFQFLGPNNVAATVSLKVRWEATGPAVRRGRGAEVPPTDPAAFLGRIAPARSTAWFSGSHVGFSFKASGDTDRGYALMGPERNGDFLT